MGVDGVKAKGPKPKRLAAVSDEQIVRVLEEQAKLGLSKAQIYRHCRYKLGWAVKYDRVLQLVKDRDIKVVDGRHHYPQMSMYG